MRTNMVDDSMVSVYLYFSGANTVVVVTCSCTPSSSFDHF